MIWIVLTSCVLNLYSTSAVVTVNLPSSTYQYSILDDHGYSTVGLNSVVFMVKACKDAHVGLFETNNVNGNVYEIVIGGWTNTKSVIRKSKQGEIKIFKNAIVLDCNNCVVMWVSWIGGVIKTGRGSSVGCDVLMSWTDPSPRTVARVGIAMYYAAGFWIFDFPYNSTSCSTTSTTIGNTIQTTNIETTTMDISTESVVTTTLIETTTENPTSDLHTTTDSVVMTTLTDTTTIKPTTDLYTNTDNIVMTTFFPTSTVETTTDVDTTDNDMTTLIETTTMKPTTDLYTTTDSVAMTTLSPTSTVDTTTDVNTTESGVMTTFSETSPVETKSDTTEIIQSVSFTSTTSDNTQQCHCSCSSVNIDLSEKELLQKNQQLKIDMTVVTKETNKYKRSLISSPDNRVSSKIIGWTGISVVLCVLLVIVLLDIGHLLRFISSFQTVFTN